MPGLFENENIEDIEFVEAVNYFANEMEKYNEMKVNAMENQNGEVLILPMDQNCADGERALSIYEMLNLKTCSEEEKNYIKWICMKFPYQFYIEGDILGCTEVIQHHIKLKPNAGIINVRQYRIPQTVRGILREFVNDYERQGIIEKCQSAYNSPALLVMKKDEFGGTTDYRFVVDYRKLNEVIEIENFPIPLIDDILNGLSGCSYFTTLDLKGAFHQIVIDEASRDYTAFTAGNFQYRWVRMPMGLATAPLTWQRAINTILASYPKNGGESLIGNGVYVYLDDVIIYSKTKDEHDKLLLRVMTLLKEHNLQLKISKCVFYAKEFGHIISKDGMRANPKKSGSDKELSTSNDGETYPIIYWIMFIF